MQAKTFAKLLTNMHSWRTVLLNCGLSQWHPPKWVWDSSKHQRNTSKIIVGLTAQV